MITLGQKIEILRLYFVEGKPKKQIARELKVSKNTVKTYIAEFLKSKKELIESGVSKYELIENMVEKPTYNSKGRTATAMTDEVKNKIIEFIKQNELKRNTGKAKMCMTSQDMYETLLEQGFVLSYSSVAHYVHQYKDNEYTYEAFIKQQYDYGDICEFDWGDVKLIIDGKEVKYRMAVFTMAKSNFRFAYLYNNENTQSFIDAHIRFFEYIGGVPKCMVYDNMKVAVAKKRIFNKINSKIYELYRYNIKSRQAFYYFISTKSIFCTRLFSIESCRCKSIYRQVRNLLQQKTSSYTYQIIW